MVSFLSSKQSSDYDFAHALNVGTVAGDDERRDDRENLRRRGSGGRRED
jgi:hypothetical protein